MSHAEHVRAAVAMLLLAAPAAAAGPVVVVQQDRAFTVHAIQISHGETVRFTNNDQFTHQLFVASPGFAYESGEQAPGQTINVAFPKAGVFDVQCHIHPKMHLRVDVR